MISYYIILKELKSVSIQALSMAVPDSQWSDTHSAVRALWNTSMEKDILGDSSTLHFAGKALHFPAAMINVQAGFGQGSFIHCLEHRHRGTTTRRSRHWWAPCLALQWKQELERNTRCVSAPCRCLTGREQKKTTKMLSCVWGYTISVSSCSCPSNSHLQLDLKLAGNQLAFPRDNKSDS